jgi:hypothetical protein
MRSLASAEICSLLPLLITLNVRYPFHDRNSSINKLYKSGFNSIKRMAIYAEGFNMQIVIIEQVLQKKKKNTFHHFQECTNDSLEIEDNYIPNNSAPN